MAISHESIANHNILTLERGQTMAISEEELLYRWLYCSGSKALSDRYFNAYYEAVTRSNNGWLTFLRRKFSKQPRIADELVQEVFCRLTERFANRPKAAGRIQELAPTLNLSALGDIHQRQTKNWSETAADWSKRSMQLFQQHYDASLGTVDSEGLGQRTLVFNGELTNELPLLRIKGAQLISWALPESEKSFQTAEDSFNQMNEEPIEMGEYPHHEIARLVEGVKQRLKLDEIRALEIHQLRTKHWRTDIANWARQSISCDDELKNEPTDLWIQGAKLISWALLKTNDPIASIDNYLNEPSEENIEINDDLRRKIRSLVEQVIQWLKQNEIETDKYFGIVGSAVFIRNTGDILKLLPKLPIPYKIELNFYLFRVANNLVKDYYRDLFNKVDAFPDVNEQEDSNTYTIPEDPEKQDRERRTQEGQKLLADVYAILEAPVKEAEAALRDANNKAERRIATIELEKAQQRYTQDMLLLEFWLRDDYTREKMSEQLDLDRKTVTKRLNKLWEQLSPLKN